MHGLPPPSPSRPNAARHDTGQGSRRPQMNRSATKTPQVSTANHQTCFRTLRASFLSFVSFANLDIQKQPFVSHIGQRPRRAFPYAIPDLRHGIQNRYTFARPRCGLLIDGPGSIRVRRYRRIADNGRMISLAIHHTHSFTSGDYLFISASSTLEQTAREFSHHHSLLYSDSYSYHNRHGI